MNLHRLRLWMRWGQLHVEKRFWRYLEVRAEKDILAPTSEHDLEMAKEMHRIALLHAHEKTAKIVGVRRLLALSLDDEHALDSEMNYVGTTPEAGSHDA